MPRSAGTSSMVRSSPSSKLGPGTPVEELLGLRTVASVPEDLARAVPDELDRRAIRTSSALLTASAISSTVKCRPVPRFSTSPAHLLARDVEQAVERLAVVVDVDEIARRRAVAVHAHWLCPGDRR